MLFNYQSKEKNKFKCLLACSPIQKCKWANCQVSDNKYSMYLYLYGLASNFQVTQHSSFALHVRLQVSKVIIVCLILILHQNFLQTICHVPCFSTPNLLFNTLLYVSSFHLLHNLCCLRNLQLTHFQ